MWLKGAISERLLNNRPHALDSTLRFRSSDATFVQKKQMKSRLKPAAPQQGQALVEFALALPILLILLAVGADFGRAYFYDLSLRDAAFAAARYGGMNPNDDAGIRNAAKLATPDSGLADASVTITSTTNPRGRGTPLQISVSYVFHPLTPVLGQLIGNTITLHETQVDIIK